MSNIYKASAIFMPRWAERRSKMTATCIVQQGTARFPAKTKLDIDVELTPQELEEIALYTIQKINKYPKSLGKTVDNYFDLLYPSEVKSYLMRRAINEKSFSGISAVTNFG